MNQEPLSVLIVDDSALMRNVVGRIASSVPDVRVVGTAMNGNFALQKLPKLEPDVIVLDLEMPEMNGIEFLKEKKRLGNEVPVVILSSIARKGAQVTMEALALGASDFIMKPTGLGTEDIHAIGNTLIEMIRAYGSQYRKQKRKAEPKPTAAPERPEPTAQELPEPKPSAPAAARIAKVTPLRQPGPIEIIAIGISTGGPNALREVFAKLEPDMNVPVVVVQHMPAGFTEEFAKSLDRICPLDVKEAVEGDLVKPGRILIAPGNRHIAVEKKPLATIVHLLDSEPVNGHRPSADVLFESVAQHYGNRALAVIMTGMGRDGAQKIGSVYREGGITLGQDEASCVVYGMPRVAYENGYLHQQVPLANMAETICRLVKEHKS